MIINRKEEVLQKVIILTEVVVEVDTREVLHPVPEEVVLPAELLDQVQLLKAVTDLQVALAADPIEVVRVIVIQVDSDHQDQVVEACRVVVRAGVVQEVVVQEVVADQVHQEEDNKNVFSISIKGNDEF